MWACVGDWEGVVSEEEWGGRRGIGDGTKSAPCRDMRSAGRVRVSRGRGAGRILVRRRRWGRG